MILTLPSRAYVAVCQWLLHFPGTVALSFLTNPPAGSTLRRGGDQLNRIFTLCFFLPKVHLGPGAPAQAGPDDPGVNALHGRGRDLVRQDCHLAQVDKDRDRNTKSNPTPHRGSLRKEGTCLSLQLEYGNQLQLHVYTGIDPRTEVHVLFP